jgi:hypothetical protein
MTTEERLEKLESELAELRKCVLTQQLIIEDDRGKNRAELNLGKDGPSLILFGGNDKPRALPVFDSWISELL